MDWAKDSGPPGADGQYDPACHDRHRERAHDVVGAIGRGDRIGGGRQVFDADELERQVIDAGMKRPGEQPERGEHTAPDCPDRVARTNALGQPCHGRPEHDVAGEKQAVGNPDLGRVRGVRGQLLGEEEMVRPTDEHAGEHEAGAYRQSDATDPAPREPGFDHAAVVGTSVHHRGVSPRSRRERGLLDLGTNSLRPDGASCPAHRRRRRPPSVRRRATSSPTVTPVASGSPRRSWRTGSTVRSCASRCWLRCHRNAAGPTSPAGRGAR